MKTMELSPSAASFCEFSRRKLLGQTWPRLRLCVASLTDEQIWWRPNPASNSVGNLVLHLDGNLRQWLVSSFGGGETHRDRPAEFNERRLIPGSALLEQLGATMEEVSKALARLTETDLLRGFAIQGEKIDGLTVVYTAVEHFGMHYGQILYITKMLRGEDLGFYSELNAPA